MSGLVVHAFEGSPNLFKALIAAEYANVNVTADTKIEEGVTLKTPEFTALNPNQKVPVLVTEKGAIWESNAIARYISRIGTPAPSFLGTNSFLASQVDQWIDWTRGELEIQLQVWVYPILGYIPYNQQATELAIKDVQKALAILNDHLKLRSFLVGDRISLADVIVSLTLLFPYKLVFDPNFRKPFPNVTRWFTTLVNQPNFAKIVGEVTLSEKMSVAAAAPPAQPPKNEKKEKQKAAPAPKKAAPKPKEEDDDLLEEEKPQKKAPNPLDSLPPSPFNLEEWKRVYSNEKDTRKACDWFWEKFDREGFSLWFCNYKYNSELDVVFKSCNLIGGYIQRLESLRKYGFVSFVLFGTNGNLSISGAFVVRGKVLPAEVTECPDSTSYDFTPVKLDDASDRKKFDDYLCWEGEFGGNPLPFNQGKIFK